MNDSRDPVVAIDGQGLQNGSSQLLSSFDGRRQFSQSHRHFTMHHMLTLCLFRKRISIRSKNFRNLKETFESAKKDVPTLIILVRIRSPEKKTTKTSFSAISPVVGSRTRPTPMCLRKTFPRVALKRVRSYWKSLDVSIMPATNPRRPTFDSTWTSKLLG